MRFLCGAARRTTTPKIGTLLYGYRPDVVSTEIHDDLALTAIAFDDGEKTVLLLTVDIGDFQTELCDELRHTLSDATGIAFSNILVAATHTHCAPNLSGIEGWGDVDRAYYDEIFCPAAIEAAKASLADRQEAEMAVEEGRSDVGINRRQYTEGCYTILGQNPWGLYDPTMTVLSFRNRETKKGIIHLIHYGCHGTACGMSTVITRDWYGGMIDRVEKQSGTLTAFINGTIGDVGPRLTNGGTTGDITHVEELGSRAAHDAWEIVKRVKNYRVPTLTVKHGTVRLPYQPFPPLEAVRAKLAEIGKPGKLFNLKALEYNHLCHVRDLLESGEAVETDGALTYEQMTVALEDVVLIPHPFEVFTETTMRLKEYSGYRHTLSLSNANGYNGYLPSQDQLCRGGYEIGVFRYALLYSLADNSDDHLVNENLRILREKEV